MSRIKKISHLDQLYFIDSFFPLILNLLFSRFINKNKSVRLVGGEKIVSLDFNLKNLYSNFISYSYIDARDQREIGKAFPQQNIIEVRNVRLDSKSGVVYSNKNEYIVDSSAWSSDYLIRSSQIKPPRFLNFRMDHFNEGNYICLSSNGFYHWLIEDLPHFIFLYQNLEEPKIIVFKNAPSYVLTLLEKLEITYIKAPRFVTLSRYYFIGREDSVGWPHPKDLDILKSFAKDTVKAKIEGKKIYISRIGSSRSPKFEPELIGELRNKGWIIIDTTFMPLTSQIEELSSASVLAGVHGAGLSGITWLESGSKVIELSNNRLVRCYERLAFLLNLKYQQIEYESREKALTVSEIVSKMENFSS